VCKREREIVYVCVRKKERKREREREREIVYVCVRKKERKREREREKVCVCVPKEVVVVDCLDELIFKLK
jgi:hypothetical protein